MQYLITFALFIQLALFSSSRFQSEFLSLEIELLENQGLLDHFIQERESEIQALNDSWRLFILEEKERHFEFLSKFASAFRQGCLALEPNGAGAAYILYDQYNEPLFIIKPTDENIFCLNNPKCFASPFLEPRAKSHIPLYRAAQTDALCYEIARMCHLQHITPKAILALISHPCFFHISNHNQTEEKLCSIQEYLTGTLPMRQVLEDFFASGLSEEDLLVRFDQEDFEDIQLFLWLTFDNDAHADNFRVYPKKRAFQGHIVYGIQKIDNSLSFPEINSGFSNTLMYFPNALLPISQRIRNRIKSLSFEQMRPTVEIFGLKSSLAAFEERIETLQKLLKRENLTYYECSLRLSLLGKPHGVDLALSNKSLEHLEYLARDLIKIKGVFFSKEAI